MKAQINTKATLWRLGRTFCQLLNYHCLTPGGHVMFRPTVCHGSRSCFDCLLNWHGPPRFKR